MATSSPILWQNDSKTVTVIDIPQSIAAAQGTGEEPCLDHLMSTTPLETPWPTNEPTTAANRARNIRNTVDPALHAQLAELIINAIGEIRSSHHHIFCRPRSFASNAITSNKRKLGNTLEPDDPPSEVEGLPAELLSSAAEHSIIVAHEVETDEDEDVCTIEAGNLVLSDPSDLTRKYRFRLPPESSFLLASCTDVDSFRIYNRAQAQELETSRKFDFILLDPPFPNRSVGRSHKSGRYTYRTLDTLQDVEHLLLNMDLDMFIADHGLVGVWTTNKQAVREMVLGADGIFDSLGVVLEEEWIWLKTTVHGEPVTPLNSVWRKPYEILLIGRRQRIWDSHTARGEVTRRVIMGVPDLHSRKPCLKELIEPLMPDATNYRALEVFARHLVAGWWSWGDECIKFNWEGCWQQEGQEGDASTMGGE